MLQVGAAGIKAGKQEGRSVGLQVITFTVILQPKCCSMYEFLISLARLTCPTRLIFIYLIILTISEEEFYLSIYLSTALQPLWTLVAFSVS
jgi:hypothetical protein